MNRHERRFLSVALLIGLLMVPGIVLARGVSEPDVRSAVETWVRQVPSEARPGAVIESMEPYEVDGQAMGYIAHLAGGGFCLCGADDLVLPVYVYCPQGAYDPEDPDLGYFLWEIEMRTRGLRRGVAERDPSLAPYGRVLEDRARLWNDLRAGRAPARMEEKGDRAEPSMMKLEFPWHWGQGSPYNDQCAVLTPPDERCVVGCVGTALAMIMNYWQWPNSGTGYAAVYDNRLFRLDWDQEPCATNPNPSIFPGTWEGRLRWTATPTGTLELTGYWDETVISAAGDLSTNSDFQDALDTLVGGLTLEFPLWEADFSAATYDWSLMDTTHTDPPDAGDQEAAELSYHAAVGVFMEFGLYGSSSHTDKVPRAVEDFFRYDPDATFASRSIATMTEEITWLRPVQLGGQRPSADGGGGHSWVVHGYDKSTDPDRLFCMNLGWYGNWDGWYACDQMPSPNASFVLDQGHSYRIAPESVVRFVDAGGSGDGTPNDPWGSVAEVAAEHPDGALIIFKAGSDNTLSSSVTLDRPCTLRGRDVLIRGL